MVLALLAACRPEGSVPEPQPAWDNVADALGACARTFDEPDAYPNQLGRGSELQRATLEDPEAVCNDGTPAVLYVRPATSAQLANVWSIHLQGGGGCSSWTACVQRWCGLQYYDASKMSSAWAPESIGAAGITDSEPDNLLATANQVFFYYCSSDQWSGLGDASYEVPEIPETTAALLPDDLPPFSMPRRGHRILDAGIDALLGGLTSDLGQQMPPLSEATQIFFSGTSAGSDGAIAHADAIAERLDHAEVHAIFDAQHTPLGEHLPDFAGALDEHYRSAWDNAITTTGAPPFVDESCAAAEADAYRCGDLTHVMAEHVSTPFFVRQDLRDVTDLAERLQIPEDVFETAAAAMLHDLAGVAGVYGPNCAQHVALETNDWWRVATVGGLTFQDAALAWVEGDPIEDVDAPVAGSVDGPDSDCAAVDGQQ